MARYGIVIDVENCMACYNCFIACRDEHCGYASKCSAPQPHEGHRWIDIREKERGDATQKIKTSSVPSPCAHCAEPDCMKAATGGAVYVRDDGIVIIDPEKSVGQRAIAEACPIGAVYWNDELNIPQKCTMCAELLDEGFTAPRCVGACPNGALHFGDLGDPDSEVSRLVLKGRVTPLPGLEGRKTNVIHLNIPTVFLAGSVYLPDDEVAVGAPVTLTNLKSGETLTTKTNCFGDWEFEWLEKGAEYRVDITSPGFEPFTKTIVMEGDHFLGEITL